MRDQRSTGFDDSSGDGSACTTSVAADLLPGMGDLWSVDGRKSL
jgi:hypothetical protein